MKYKQIVQDPQGYNNALALTSHNVVCSFSLLSGLLLLSKKTGDAPRSYQGLLPSSVFSVHVLNLLLIE